MEESENIFKKSILLAADTVDIFSVQLADFYYGTQRYAEAADKYTRTIQIRNKYAGDLNIRDDAVFLQLARCLNRLGKNDQAIGYAVQAVNINPKNEEARNLVYELWIKGLTKVKPK